MNNSATFETSIKSLKDIEQKLKMAKFVFVGIS